MRPRRLVLFCLLSCASITNPSVAQSFSDTRLLSLLVRTIHNCDDPTTQAALLRGMLQGLEGRRNVPMPDGWQSLRTTLADSTDADVRETARRLSQRFGDRGALEQAMSVVFDQSAPVERRQESLAALVAARYQPLAGKLIELVDVPELSIIAIRAYAILDDPMVPAMLLGRYAESSPPARRAIVETLATRKNYAIELTRAIGNNVVPRGDIPSYVARSLEQIVGQPFVDVYGRVPELTGDINDAIAGFRKVLTEEALASADARRGKAVFQKTCAACHLMYGEGGSIGPDLTGSNRANLDYLLLNSVAPSADVPEGYRTELVQTTDGRILTGVLAEEDNQRIVLKTVDQPRLVIAKTEIEARKVSDKSMMPEGQLDQLSKQELLNLVKYMQTKTQVESLK